MLMSADTTLVIYGSGLAGVAASSIVRLTDASSFTECPGETLLALPESPRDYHEFIYNLLRRLAAARSSRLLVFLDGMPTGLAAATINGMTLCGRIHDHILLDGHPVPFTRLGYWLDEQRLVLPDAVAERFDRINCELIRNAVTPELYLNPDSCRCLIDAMTIELDSLELLLYWLLLLRAGNQLPPVRGLAVLTEELNAFMASTAAYVMPEVERLRQRHGVLSEETTDSLLDGITKKITASVSFDDGCFFCLPQPTPGVYGVMLHHRRVNCPRNY